MVTNRDDPATATLRLGVNIDHVATLRQTRGTRYPDPVEAALEAEQAGADGITLHLREDRRHIQDRDVDVLKEVLQKPMNLELAITEEMLRIACRTAPDHCCLVPEKREELTTEGGLDVASQVDRVTDAHEQLVAAGIKVSLFIDPDSKQIDAARETGAPVIEIHTGGYADASDEVSREQELQRIVDSVRYAASIGLEVHGGHGLSYNNVDAIAAIPEIIELNIGHAIVARAVFTGIAEAVREMKRLMLDARKP